GGAPRHPAPRPPRRRRAERHSRRGHVRSGDDRRRHDEPHGCAAPGHGHHGVLLAEGVPARRRGRDPVRMSTHTPHDEVELEEFPPTLREVMLRPRWIGLLALCLVVAGVFSWLLQWQLTRALTTSPVAEGQTEQVVPLDDVVAPRGVLDGPFVGQRVDVTGAWDPDDFLVVTDRMNDGVEGYWVTGRLETSGASLATAIGWA